MGVDSACVWVDIVKYTSTDIAAQGTDNTAIVEPERLLAHPDAAASCGCKSTGSNETTTKADTVNAVDVRQTDIAHEPCFVLRPDQGAFTDSSTHDDLAGRVQIKITSCVDRRCIVPIGIVFTR